MPMANPYSQISIRCGGLIVELGTETQYPDMIDDMSRRCLETFKEAVNTAKENGVDISDMRLITTDYGDETEEE
jgi:hypothetical protein